VLVSDKTAIEWTESTWNPVTGCSKVSPGCAHCYAETLALTRLAGKEGYPGQPWTPANAAANVLTRPARLDQPLRWKRPRMIFTNSMSDLFHELVSDRFVAEVFAVMALAEHHTFQVLTKRPERMRVLLNDPMWWAVVEGSAQRIWAERHHGQDPSMWLAVHGPLPNVWLGTSIENRRFVGRADDLRATPAAIRFISAEPLLGPLVRHRGDPDDLMAALEASLDLKPWLDLTDIDWLIVGGESGPGHRPMREEWVRELRDTCVDTGRACEHCHGFGWQERGPCPEYADADCACRGTGRQPRTGTAFFFKQHGGATPKSGGRELDDRTWDEMPSEVSG
jgi:protein gp37